MTDPTKLREAIAYYEQPGPPNTKMDPRFLIVLDAAKSTLPKTKVETAYYVEIYAPSGKKARRRFTSDVTLFEEMQIEMQNGCSFVVDPPRQEEVPA